MGRQTRLKQAAAEAKTVKPLLALANHQPKAEINARNLAKSLLSPYRENFYKPSDTAPSIKSNDPTKQVINLVRHVFGPYKVPKILNQVWEVTHYHNLTQEFYCGRGREWYIAIASGKSVYKEYLQNFFTKKQAHFFLNCVHPFTLVQATTYARALAYGASDPYAQKLARSKLSEANVPLDVTQFFVLNPVTTIQQLNDYVDYLTAVYAANPNTQILGRGITLKTLDVRMEQWHRELARVKDMSDLEWEGHPIPNWSFTKEDELRNDAVTEWTIHQILNGKELAAEGTYMHHCVYSYKPDAVEGRCSLWSMRSNGQRQLTLEVKMPPNKSGYRVVQIQGRFRRKPTLEESALIERWSRECFAKVVPTPMMQAAMAKASAVL